VLKELVVVSGKGGAGKTSITASFAALGDKMVLCDTDVDASNLHLLMNPKIEHTGGFQGGNQAIIDQSKCTQCGICSTMCRFNAIDAQFRISPIECEGCGVCVHFCPEQAIEFPVKTCGQWFISETKTGPMVHAKLGVAEESSGKLVTLVRRKAKEIAEKTGRALILTDGPPGIGCPVIASITAATAILIVTEPTVSGIHDMKRLVELAAGLRLPMMLCINKADLNLKQTSDIEQYARQNKMKIVGKIPFDPIFIESLTKGRSVVDYDPLHPVSQKFRKIWDQIHVELEQCHFRQSVLANQLFTPSMENQAL
jgi:MinD superfamily P-loop ATPase